MAIIIQCGVCGKSFGTSVAMSKYMCDDCDGTNAAKQKETDRWASLTADQKADELLARVRQLEQRQGWDGRIG